MIRNHGLGRVKRDGQTTSWPSERLAPKLQTNGDQQSCLTSGNNINTTVWVINPTSSQQCLRHRIKKQLASKSGWESQVQDNEPPKPARNNKPQATTHESSYLLVFKSSNLQICIFFFFLEWNWLPWSQMTAKSASMLQKKQAIALLKAKPIFYNLSNSQS